MCLCTLHVHLILHWAIQYIYIYIYIHNMLWIHINICKPHTSKDMSWLLRHRWGKSSQTSRFGRMPPVDLKAGSILQRCCGIYPLRFRNSGPKGMRNHPKVSLEDGHQHWDFAGKPPMVWIDSVTVVLSLRTNDHESLHDVDTTHFVRRERCCLPLRLNHLYATGSFGAKSSST